jgi:hypothetical protein
MPASVWIINLVVLVAVLEADLGHRKITLFRLIRPVLLAAAVVAFFYKKLDMTGNALTCELVLIVLGIGLGVAAGSLFRVYRVKGSSWSHAGAAYAALWAVVIAARLLFVYATYHSHAVDNWLRTQHLTSATVTDALLGMAVAMVLARTASLRIRAHRLERGASDLEPEPTTPKPAVSVPAATN